MKVEDPFSQRLVILNELVGLARSLVAIGYVPLRGPLRVRLNRALGGLAMLEVGSPWPVIKGGDKLERQRLRRKMKRWAARLDSLPPTERRAVVGQLLIRYVTPANIGG
jgi:hypothetical protein